MAKTVFVGLSGGVDSAVSAMLLKQATPNNFEKLFGRPTPEGFRGFNVVGVFIKIWQPEFIECTWAADRLDAMRVAVALGIPFREIDLSSDYQRMVVEDTVAAYARGVTPNPDVLCNRHIKFGSFMNYALHEGADFIATGHYVRNEKSRDTFSLLRGLDNDKDQSYFLYALGQAELARTMFPVGGLHKKQVRRLATKWRLPVAHKPDSQGLCFVGDVSMKDFLSRYIKFECGQVIDPNGTVVGTHDGAALYTIGQRHGFLIEGRDVERTAHYVVSVDVAENTICVSQRREDAARKEVLLDGMHWIENAPVLPLRAQTQARYREEPHDATIEDAGSGIKIIFNEPHIAALGQSLVAYEGERCLGGWVIAN